MTLASLSQRLQSGDCSAVEMLQDTLQRCRQPAADHVFTLMTENVAMQQAEQADRLRQSGEAGPWAGIPITIKDLFDLEGTVTMAGSKVLANAKAEDATASAIQRLIDAGFVIIGKANMTEFAYSGLGLNPHYGTPVNPWSGESELIPGGSSAGGAVSVALDIVAATIGTDTGGSVRIPSSLCNLTGFKPASMAVPADGVVPLAESLDSIGPLANSVACCSVLHNIMSGQGAEPVCAAQANASGTVSGLRMLIPEQSVLWLHTDIAIAERCEAALQRLEAAGAELVRSDTLFFDKVLESGVQSVLAGFESARWHRALLEGSRNLYDPRVSSRIDNGAKIDEALYHDALQIRAEFKRMYRELLTSFDAVVWPTTALYAPAFSELESDEGYSRVNLDLLRNTSVGNTLDAAAITLPLPCGWSPLQPQTAKPEGQQSNGLLPAGLMLHQCGDQDRELLQVAALIEGIVTGESA